MSAPEDTTKTDDWEKQMRLKYAQAYDEAEVRHEDLPVAGWHHRQLCEYISVVLSNTVQSMAAVIEALDMLGIDLKTREEKIFANRILDSELIVDELSDPIREALKALAISPAIQAAVASAHKFQVRLCLKP
jgi:hypothetical protein